jgi:hypothetical protein
MGLGRVGGYIFVALVTALLTFYVVRVTNGDAARCDVHPSLTSSNRAAIKANLERARAAAHEATMNDKHDQQAAYQAEEASAEQEFIYDLRDTIGAEYRRHRRALDGCY